MDISPAIVNVLAEAGITSRKVLKHMTEKELREAGCKIGKEEAVVRAANMAMKRNIYNNEYKSQKRNIPFSPPDMTEKALTGVSEASGVQRVSMTS